MKPDPWRRYLFAVRDSTQAEADRLERTFYSSCREMSGGARRMIAKLHRDAAFIDSLIRGFDIMVFVPRPGDAIKARSMLLGCWMGGVIETVDVKGGVVTLVAGGYDLTFDAEPSGILCVLAGATVVRYQETYRDSDSVIYQELA